LGVSSAWLLDLRSAGLAWCSADPGAVQRRSPPTCSVATLREGMSRADHFPGWPRDPCGACPYACDPRRRGRHRPLASDASASAAERVLGGRVRAWSGPGRNVRVTALAGVTGHCRGSSAVGLPPCGPV